MQLKHHAYLIEVLPQEFLAVQNHVLKDVDKQVTEIKIHEQLNLGIDVARDLIDTYTKSVLSGIENRIVFIMAQSLTHEAQNALLKFFEEPRSGNHFILCVYSRLNLLPTFRSRFEVLKFKESEQENALIAEAVRFVNNLTPSERLKFVDKMSDDLAEERITKSDILVFLNNVEETLYKQLKKSGTGNSNSSGLIASIDAVLLAEKHILDRSSSAKILLEHVAFMIA